MVSSCKPFPGNWTESGSDAKLVVNPSMKNGRTVMGKALMHLQCLSRNDNRSECKSLPPTLRQNPESNANGASGKFCIIHLCTRTVPPRFLRFISAFSQVRFRELRFACVERVKTEALANAC